MFRLFAKSAKKSRAAKRPKHRQFSVEHLEKRELMAYNIFAGTPAPIGPGQSKRESPTALLASPGAGASAAPMAAATSHATVTTQKATAAKVDLDVNVNEGYVVATQSDDLLNLLHFWGGEKVLVPSTVKNYGPNTFSGKVTVDFYLSTGRIVDSKAVKLGAVTRDVTLGNNQETTFSLRGTIPTSLTVGTKYFLVCKVTTPVKQSTINDVRNSNRQFEFVGTPSATSNWFQPNEVNNLPYLDAVNDTIKGKLMYDNPYQLNEPSIMLAEHEGFSNSAYLNIKGVPTLGIGINLTALSPPMEKSVATAVRNYYKQQYQQTLSGTDKQVIALLVSQARAGLSTPALRDADVLSLFSQDYKERGAIAEKLLGKSTWSQINPPARIAVMDMIFDTGTIDKKVVASLQAKDYVRAGFDLLNTGSVNREQKRARAEYQNLVYSVRSSLGADAGTYK